MATPGARIRQRADLLLDATYRCDAESRRFYGEVRSKCAGLVAQLDASSEACAEMKVAFHHHHDSVVGEEGAATTTTTKTTTTPDDVRSRRERRASIQLTRNNCEQSCVVDESDDDDGRHSLEYPGVHEEEEEEEEEEETPPSLPIGQRVTVAGTSREDINGNTGSVVSYDSGKGRYQVELDHNGGVIALKAGNVVPVAVAAAATAAAKSVDDSPSSGGGGAGRSLFNQQKMQLEGHQLKTGALGEMKGREEEEEEEEGNGGDAQQQKRPRQFFKLHGWPFFFTMADPYMQWCGTLQKKGGGKSLLGRRNWTVRYFVLADGLLQYYKDEDTFRRNVPPLKKFILDVTNCTVAAAEGTTTDKDHMYRFSLTPNTDDDNGRGKTPRRNKKGRALELRARTLAEREDWLKALRTADICRPDPKKVQAATAAFHRERAQEKTHTVEVEEVKVKVKVGVTPSSTDLASTDLGATPSRERGRSIMADERLARKNNEALKRSADHQQGRTETKNDPPLRESPRAQFEKSGKCFTRVGTDPAWIALSGHVEKKGGGARTFGRRNWKERYFVLADGLLQYYETEENWEANEPPLKNSTFDVRRCAVNAVQNGTQHRFDLQPHFTHKQKCEMRAALMETGEIPESMRGVRILHMRVPYAQIKGDWIDALVESGARGSNRRKSNQRFKGAADVIRLATKMRKATVTKMRRMTGTSGPSGSADAKTEDDDDIDDDETDGPRRASMCQMKAVRKEVRASVALGPLSGESEEHFREIYERLVAPNETAARADDGFLASLLDHANVDEESVLHYIASMEGEYAQEAHSAEARSEMELLLKVFSPEQRAERPAVTFLDFMHLIHVCTQLSNVRNDLEQATELKSAADAALKEKRYDLAVRLYTDAIAFAPSQALHGNRSAAYLGAGDAHAALQDADLCVEEDREWPKGHSRRGAALEALGRTVDAIAAYREAAQLYQPQTLAAISAQLAGESNGSEHHLHTAQIAEGLGAVVHEKQTDINEELERMKADVTKSVAREHIQQQARGRALEQQAQQAEHLIASLEESGAGWKDQRIISREEQEHVGTDEHSNLHTESPMLQGEPPSSTTTRAQPPPISVVNEVDRGSEAGNKDATESVYAAAASTDSIHKTASAVQTRFDRSRSADWPPPPSYEEQANMPTRTPPLARAVSARGALFASVSSSEEAKTLPAAAANAAVAPNTSGPATSPPAASNDNGGGDDDGPLSASQTQCVDENSPRARFDKSGECFTYSGTSSSYVIGSGFLEKKGAAMKKMLSLRKWQERFFVLADGLLQYYKSEMDWKDDCLPIKNVAFDMTRCIVTDGKPDKQGNHRMDVCPLLTEEQKRAVQECLRTTGKPPPGLENMRILHLRAPYSQIKDDWVGYFVKGGARDGTNRKRSAGRFKGDACASAVRLAAKKRRESARDETVRVPRRASAVQMKAVRDEARTGMDSGPLPAEAEEHFREIYEGLLVASNESVARADDGFLASLLDHANVDEQSVLDYIADMEGEYAQEAHSAEARSEMELLLKVFSPEQRSERPAVTFQEFVRLVHFCTLLADVHEDIACDDEAT